MNKNIFEGIQYFITIAQFGSIRLASNHLGVEQKTIRHKIKLLEKYLGIALIESSSIGSTLTDKGWEIHGALANDFQGLVNKVEVISKGEKPNQRTEQFKIFMPAGTANLFSIHIVPKLYKMFPNISVDIVSFNLKYILFYGSQLKNIINNMDMIILDDITLSIIHPDDWRIVSRYVEKLYLHTSRSYLDKVGPIENIKDLDGLDFIGKAGIHNQNGNIHLINHKTGDEQSINFNIIFNAETELVKAYLLNKGLGISMLGRSTLHSISLHKDLQLVPLLTDYNNKKDINYSILTKNSVSHPQYAKEVTKLINEATDSWVAYD